MLDWTGERFLPWRNDPALAYEHLHRYLYVEQLVAGKAVLDLASGEGYGSNMLAQTAASVVGLDIDNAAVEHARLRYARDNLRFVTGSVTDVPIDGFHLFDVVVCFEAIEHIEDQDLLFSEVIRLLKPGGLFVVSTPNKAVYDAAIQEENEFHVKELDFDEFRALIDKHFKYSCFLGQRIHAESNLWPIADGGGVAFAEFVVERGDSEFAVVPRNKLVPMYFVAVASNASIEASLPTSILVDTGNELLDLKDRAIRELLQSKESQQNALKWREEQIAERDKSIAWFGEEAQILKAELEYFNKVIVDLKATIGSHEEALVWRAGQVESLEKEKAALIRTLEVMTMQLGRITERLEAIDTSSGWKFVLKIRRYRDAFLPAGSGRRRFIERLTRIFKA